MKSNYLINNILAMFILDIASCVLCLYLCNFFALSWRIITLLCFILVLIVIPWIVWNMQPAIQAYMNRKVINDE